MKKIIFLLFLFSGKHALAQDNQDVYVTADNRPLHNHFSEQAQGNVKGYVNYVNSKAARHLFKNFTDANSVQWVIDEHENTAYFTRDGEFIKVRYDMNGRHISTRKTYAANKLDRYVAFLAKMDLDKDFSIYGVTEVATDTGKVYEIILQNKYYWGVVKIAEDNMGNLETLAEAEVFLKV
jgi:hypothetical protein